MPNLSQILKEEIARVARKELRQATEVLKRSIATLKADRAGQAKKIKALEQRVGSLTRATRKIVPSTEAQDVQPKNRYSARSVAAQRKRLGLSAADYGRLIGVTGQSIYKWEEGTATPRATQKQALASIRGIGKREALARLAQTS